MKLCQSKRVLWLSACMSVFGLTLANSSQAQLLEPHYAAANISAPVDAIDKPEPEPLQARGVLKAAQTAEISASLPARIERLPYKSGQYFDSGALLVKFDCQKQMSEAEALEHAHNALSVKYENVNELFNAGAAGELDRSIAAADRDRAAADIKVAKARLTDCTIYAPYSGYVKTRHASAFDTPTAGQPLLSIIRAGRPEITLIAPSAWMRWMKPGSKFEFTIDETGNTHMGQIIRLGASVDPVSQTIEVTAKFTSSAKGALSGMSGVASFTPPTSPDKKG